MDKPTDWYSGTRLEVSRRTYKNESNTLPEALYFMRSLYITAKSKQQVNSIPIAS